MTIGTGHAKHVPTKLGAELEYSAGTLHDSVVPYKHKMGILFVPLQACAEVIEGLLHSSHAGFRAIVGEGQRVGGGAREVGRRLWGGVVSVDERVSGCASFDLTKRHYIAPLEIARTMLELPESSFRAAGVENITD